VQRRLAAARTPARRGAPLRAALAARRAALRGIPRLTVLLAWPPWLPAMLSQRGRAAAAVTAVAWLLGGWWAAGASAAVTPRVTAWASSCCAPPVSGTAGAWAAVPASLRASALRPGRRAAVVLPRGGLAAIRCPLLPLLRAAPRAAPACGGAVRGRAALPRGQCGSCPVFVLGRTLAAYSVGRLRGPLRSMPAFAPALASPMAPAAHAGCHHTGLSINQATIKQSARQPGPGCLKLSRGLLDAVANGVWGRAS